MGELSEHPRGVSHSTLAAVTEGLLLACCWAGAPARGHHPPSMIHIPKATTGGLNYADVLFFCGKGLDTVNIELLNGGGASYVNA